MRNKGLGSVGLAFICMLVSGQSPLLRSYCCSAMSTDPTAKQLQNLWATSYDAWLNVPNHDEPVVYLCPQETITADRRHKKLPRVVEDHCLFGLTGYNPMGKDRDLETNQKANHALKQDLQRLLNPKPTYIWDSFGFADQWREDGFIVAYPRLEESAGKAAIIDLAKKYQQGAIYGFTSNMKGGKAVSLLRKTIPAAMSNVEADTVVVACEKPTGIKNADV